jgi:transposase
MWYVGADVHLKSSSVCVLDDHGRRIRQKKICGPWTELITWLKELEEPVSVCYEASSGYGPLYDALSQFAVRVDVAHPGHLRLIFRSKRKSDRVDAEKLAKLLYLGEVPTVHVPSPEIRAWRGTAEHRARLVRRRTCIKNRLRALLRSCGIIAPRGLWTLKGHQWLVDVELPTALDTMRRDMLLDELDTAVRQVKHVQRHLDVLARTNAGVQLLMTIPGVGVRTAETVLAYIDDPRRFKNNKCVASYFGLVPSQNASGSFNRLGHITKEGPGTVRCLLTEAAWQGIRRSTRIRAYFERIQRDDPDRKKIALVATAHYLIRVMHAMLRTGEAWREAEDFTVAA